MHDEKDLYLCNIDIFQIFLLISTTNYIFDKQAWSRIEPRSTRVKKKKLRLKVFHLIKL